MNHEQSTILSLDNQLTTAFSSEKPYWAGIAENEYHLYDVVHVESLE
jgi:hypothetical protein